MSVEDVDRELAEELAGLAGDLVVVAVSRGVVPRLLMPESKSIQHLSVQSPEGTEQSDTPALLRLLADQLEEIGPIEVQDITIGTQITNDGFVYRLTVYFHPAEAP